MSGNHRLTMAANADSRAASSYGTVRVQRAGSDLLDYSERMMRAFLAQVPAGSYQAEDFLDNDGVSCAVLTEKYDTAHIFPLIMITVISVVYRSVAPGDHTLHTRRAQEMPARLAMLRRACKVRVECLCSCHCISRRSRHLSQAPAAATYL